MNYVACQGRQGNFHNYHPGMRNQQNHGWRNTQYPNQFQNQNMGASSSGFVPRPHQQQVPPPQENKKQSLEEMFQMYMASNEKVIQQQQTLLQSHGSTLQQHTTLLQNQGASIRNLETRMRQITSSLNTRPYGTLPANTQPNPRTDRMEHCKMITLRSGKELAGSKASEIDESSKG